jgi:hypothetical protein
MDLFHWLGEVFGLGGHHEPVAADHPAEALPGSSHLAGTVPGQLGVPHYEELAGVAPGPSTELPAPAGSEVLDRVNAQLAQTGVGEQQAPHILPEPAPAGVTPDPYRALAGDLQGQIYVGQVENSIAQEDLYNAQLDSAHQAVQDSDQAIDDASAAVDSSSDI